MSRFLKRPIRALALVFIILLAGPAAAERQMFGDEASPSRYEIAIVPDAEAGTFSGAVRIDATTTAAAASIQLNAADMTIQSAAIDGRPAAAALDNDAQILTLTPARQIAPGPHVIEIAYSGRIYDEAYGLFRVSYDTPEGPRRMLATQFEPGDARRFAPMWDQPNKRAVFVVTATVPAGQSAVSNMPIAQTTQLSGGRARVRFDASPSMPSYLLFFGMGDIERIHMDVDGVDLGIVTRRGESEKGRQALRAGAESLRYYTQYFGIPYPLPKLDMIAIPGAGGFGAMENWGAILYFDQYLLMDEGSNEADRQNVFGIVAHEIAHQWFGNLVTMAWWDDLWLNEGFASWMATKAAEALHPDWTPWLGVFPDRNDAMEMDARAGTHPVVQQVDTIEQANLAFDSITYEKGQAVIRMLESYVGEEAFRTGVHTYLNARRYGNAATTDLWRDVQAASGQPIMEIARAYTTQPGFPIIDVSATACVNNAAQPITLTQARFAADDVSRTDELWQTPVVARRAGGAQELRIVTPAARETRLDVPADGCGPVVVNAGQTAFFRTRYTNADFMRLTQSFAQLQPIDQLGLMADYWAFGRAGYAPLTNYLDLVSAMPTNAAPQVIIHAASSLGSIVFYARGRASEAALTQFAIARLRPALARIGWDARPGEGSNDAIVRAALIETLGGLGDRDVVAEAGRRVAAFDADPAALPGAIRNAVFRAYAAHADAAHYRALLDRIRAESNFIEKRRLLSYITEARDPALAAQTLDLLKGETIPRPLRPTVLQNVAFEHPGLAWRFVLDNRAIVDGWLDPLRRLDYGPAIASGASDPAVADQVLQYAENFPADSRQAAQGAAAAIRARAAMIAREMPGVERWLARSASPAAGANR